MKKEIGKVMGIISIEIEMQVKILIGNMECKMYGVVDKISRCLIQLNVYPRISKL